MRREPICTAPATPPRPEVRTGDVPRPAMRDELVCTEPATPPRLEVRTRDMPRPRAGQVLVRVQASCVNPIDVKRAAGYGRRLLGLKGAASFPLVLGNDFAGTVEATGAGASRFAPGQRVFGLLGTGSSGRAWVRKQAQPAGTIGSVQSAIARRALKARYRWTLFKPSRGARGAGSGMRERRFSLPVGISAPLEDADAAFAHVAAGKPGRAVLLPCDATHRTWRSR